MAQRTNEEVIHAYIRALTENDAEALASLRDPDWFVDYPQSSERIRGHANERAIADNYPGGIPEVDAGRIVGSEDRWVVTRASPSSGSPAVARRGGARDGHAIRMAPSGTS